MRWFVGDVHGCAREFELLLGRIRFDPARDELWSVGDLVNRGPDSAAAVRLWRAVNGRGVIGNHEVYALLVRHRAVPRRPDALDDLFNAPDADELLLALSDLPALVHLPSGGAGPDVRLVHAGLDPRWTDLDRVARSLEGPHDVAWLRRPEVACATTIRCCTPDGNRGRHDGPPDGCREPFRPWDTYYRGADLVVHGHWAARGYYRGPRTLGLDSGCVWGGFLTAWCQQEDRVVRVPGRPGKGRPA